MCSNLVLTSTTVLDGDGNIIVQDLMFNFLIIWIVIVVNTISKCSTTNGKPIHYVNQNGSRTINTFISFSFSYNSMMVSTINYLNFYSSCQSCGLFPFKSSLFLKAISLSALTPSGGNQHHVHNNLFRFLIPQVRV
jgi:hypothetical protein